MARSSQSTLGTSFFDNLWPLILDDNICHIESKSVEFFVPRKPFQQLHWHTLLAKAGYPNYAMPLELRCCEAATVQDLSEEEAEQAADEEAERLSNAAHGDFEMRGSQAIRRIDKEVKYLNSEHERRQKLAYDFANRKYPWTMQTPCQDLIFELTPEISAHFKQPMEQEILVGIHNYECKLMLIDAGAELCIDDFQRWMKFRPYVQMVVMVRCPRVERHLQLLEVFHTLLVEENMENSWHEELQCSLRSGLKHAKQLELIKQCAEPFVFVFCRYRGICTCDTFKILRTQ